MRAAFYRRTGPAPDVLEIGMLSDPAPAPDEVLVQVHASGINPADVKRRAGWGGAQMSHDLVVPHCDGAGVILATGKDVPAARCGARVWLYNAQGGYAQTGRAFGTAADLIALPAAQAVALPDGLSFEQGACLGVPAQTAHRCVFADGPVDGQTVLVQGGAGVVGNLAVQMARLGGARVIATVSNADAAAHARKAGADVVIDRHHEDVAARVLALTDGRGADRIVEVDFAANMNTDTRCLRENGTIASFSCSSDPSPTLPYYQFAVKGLNLRFIQGFSLTEAARHAAIAFIDRHAPALDIVVGARFDLEDISLAHQRVETGGIGNTVLRLRPR